jgi:3-isopropylmalate dehydratase small subunit
MNNTTQIKKTNGKEYETSKLIYEHEFVKTDGNIWSLRDTAIVMDAISNSTYGKDVDSFGLAEEIMEYLDEHGHALIPDAYQWI